MKSKISTSKPVFFVILGIYEHAKDPYASKLDVVPRISHALWSGATPSLSIPCCPAPLVISPSLPTLGFLSHAARSMLLEQANLRCAVEGSGCGATPRAGCHFFGHIGKHELTIFVDGTEQLISSTRQVESLRLLILLFSGLLAVRGCLGHLLEPYSTSNCDRTVVTPRCSGDGQVASKCKPPILGLHARCVLMYLHPSPRYRDIMHYHTPGSDDIRRKNKLSRKKRVNYGVLSY